VRGVDEVDPELHGSAQDAACLVQVAGLAPDARPRDAHRAEAEAVHEGSISQLDLPAQGGR